MRSHPSQGLVPWWFLNWLAHLCQGARRTRAPPTIPGLGILWGRGGRGRHAGLGCRWANACPCGFEARRPHRSAPDEERHPKVQLDID